MRSLRLVHSDDAVSPVDAALRALLRHVRVIVPLSPAVRARALARARAALAARVR